MEFREYVGVIRARKATVLLAMALFMLAAFAVTVARPALYTAEARVLISQSDAVNSLLGIAPGVYQPDRDMQTHAELARSPEVAAGVLEKLKLRTTPEALASRVVVEPVGGSDLLAVRAEDESPKRAAAIANGFAAGYVEQRAAQQAAELKAARDGFGKQRKALAERLGELDSQVSNGKAGATASRDSVAAALTELDAQIERLGAGGALDLAGTRVVTPASAARAGGGGALSTALLVGAAIGLVVGIGAAFTAEHFDTRLRTAADAGGFGLAVVGALPAERQGGRGSASLTMLREPSSPGSDAYRLLRRSLRAAGAPGRSQVIAVTAPVGPGNPPAVAANLALALAQAGDRVTLIDCDLRRSPLQAMFGLQASAGLADALTGARQLSEVMQHPVHQRLAVIAGGGMPSAPAEVLGSPRMQQIVREAAGLSDWVVLSTPPLLETADTAAVLEWAERLLLVLRVRETRGEQVERAVDLLGRLGVASETQAVVLGVPESGQGLESYLVGTDAVVGGRQGGTVEALRPGEALAR